MRDWARWPEKYKVVMQGFWGAAAMLLLAASRQLGTREAIPANWLVALALLGVSWCVLTVFLSVRYRAANAMEIYPEEYSTVYRLCNVVPLLAAVLAEGILCAVLLARHGQPAKLAPLAMAWVLSLAAPVSWMVLSKAHAAIHTHLVPMLWHFALVPVSCLALVVMTKEIVSLLFRRRPDLVASH